jgi:hypothetical protein
MIHLQCNLWLMTYQDGANQIDGCLDWVCRYSAVAFYARMRS